MSGPEVLMADGAIKRQGDSLVPQGVAFRALRVTDAGQGTAWNGPVAFDAKVFDPFGFFDGTKFQPKIAGYYRLSTNLVLSGGTSGAQLEVAIAKNGTIGTIGTTQQVTALPAFRSDGWGGANVTDIIYFNGTTDYAEVYDWMSASATLRGTAGERTSFSAELIGASVGVIPEPWHNVGAPGEPAFAAGWSNNYSDTANYARFFKDPHGIVHLNGSIKSNGTAALAFTLPVGYRPTQGAAVTLAFWNGSTRVLGIIAIGSDGGIRIYGGADAVMAMTYVNIDCEFRGEG